VPARQRSAAVATERRTAVVPRRGTIIAVKKSMPPLEAPLDQLERTLIAEFVRARGYDPLRLAELPEHDRIKLLKEASTYASGKLTEMESREHFLDEIHRGGGR
jgi:hypothetical protein